MTNPVNSQPRSPVPTTFDPAPMSMSLAETPAPLPKRRTTRSTKPAVARRAVVAVDVFEGIASADIESALDWIRSAHADGDSNHRCSSNSNPRVGASINQGTHPASQGLTAQHLKRTIPRGAAWWTRSMERSSPRASRSMRPRRTSHPRIRRTSSRNSVLCPSRRRWTTFFDRLSDLLLKPGEFDFETAGARLGCEGGEIYYLISGPLGLMSLPEVLLDLIDGAPGSTSDVQDISRYTPLTHPMNLLKLLVPHGRMVDRTACWNAMLG